MRRTFGRILLLVLSIPLFHARLHAEGGSPLPPAAMMDSVQTGELRAHAAFLASVELGGRHTTSPSAAIAARYLASSLRSYGFKGGGDSGDFLQRFTLVDSISIRQSAKLTVAAATPSSPFDTEEDLYLFPESAAGTWESEAVFARHGVTAPDGSYDDYASLDVKGKIVVVGSGLPSVAGAPEWASTKSYNVMRKVQNAAAHGAAALILLGDRERESSSSKHAAAAGYGTLTLADTRDTGRTVPALRLSRRASETLLLGTGMKLSDAAAGDTLAAPRALGKRLTLETTRSADSFSASNVVGILEGSDPKLKNEYVMFSAHYDHLRSRDGKVFTGADDDGSGTSAVLEIAQAMSLGPRPSRSILIILHTGEEEGLLGSAYYVRHPSVPLNAIVATFNIDMIGRSRSDDDDDGRDGDLTDRQSVYLIGSDKLSDQLHNLSEETNRDTERFTLDYRYNRTDHPERLYYRSDHWNYAKQGIPVIFYFTGLHKDYHQPTDTVDKLDFEKMSRITRLVLATGWKVANLNHRIVVNHPVDGQSSGR